MATLNPRGQSQKALDAMHREDRTRQDRTAKSGQNRNQGGQGRGNNRAPDHETRKSKRGA
jgi:hypothetical protein